MSISSVQTIPPSESLLIIDSRNSPQQNAYDFTVDISSMRKDSIRLELLSISANLSIPNAGISGHSSTLVFTHNAGGPYTATIIGNRYFTSNSLALAIAGAMKASDPARTYTSNITDVDDWNAIYITVSGGGATNFTALSGEFASTSMPSIYGVPFRIGGTVGTPMWSAPNMIVMQNPMLFRTRYINITSQDLIKHLGSNQLNVGGYDSSLFNLIFIDQPKRTKYVTSKERGWSYKISAKGHIGHARFQLRDEFGNPLSNIADPLCSTTDYIMMVFKVVNE